MVKRFHYCRYWGTWSRRLSSDHPHGPFVEVNLTPIPNCGSSTWDEDVRPIIVRIHGTAPERGDKDTDELPPKVKADMVKFLGEGLTEYLLNHDFLSEIDDKLLRTKMRGGGVPLDDIRKR